VRFLIDTQLPAAVASFLKAEAGITQSMFSTWAWLKAKTIFFGNMPKAIKL